MISLPREVPWYLQDLATVTSNGMTVMSTFACGGGSTMGYKRAGFEVVAANDIDPEMATHYVQNHKPRHYYLEPIGSLVAKARGRDLPAELYRLDILDGSPPCSLFSTSGRRQKGWGKALRFREGQATQILDDLFFDYLDLVEALRPRVSVAENVKGLVQGVAKGYVKLIHQRYVEMGYNVQLFLMNATSCGVAQRRERVFFVATRDERSPLRLNPSDPPVEVRTAWRDMPKHVPPPNITKSRSPILFDAWTSTAPGSYFGKDKLFSHYRLSMALQSCTITTRPCQWHPNEPRNISGYEAGRLGAFPDDYQFANSKIYKYMIGMSVPPFMIQVIAEAIRDQWLS